MGNGASLDLDPNISEEKLQKIARVWELFFENAQKRVAAREAWLADPVGFNTHYNKVVTSPKNSNRRQAPAYSPGPRKEWRSKVLDDDVPSARSPSVRREKTPSPPKTPVQQYTVEWDSKNNAVFYEPHSYKGPARWKLPANAEIVGDRTAGWTRCWDDSNKAHFYRPPNGGTACWNAPASLKEALDAAEYTEHFDPESGRTYVLSRITGKTEWVTSSLFDAQPRWCRVVNERGKRWFEDESTGHISRDPPPNAYESDWVRVAAKPPYYLHEPTSFVCWNRPWIRARKRFVRIGSCRSAGSTESTSDDYFYKDLATGQTQWDAPEDVLCRGWVECCTDDPVDPPFYYERKSGRSVWVPPWA